MTPLFHAILNMSVTGGIVAVAILLLRLPLKRAPRWITCALWAVVFLRLVLPVSFSAPVSLLGGIGAPAPENGVVMYLSNTATEPATGVAENISNDSQPLPLTQSASESMNSFAPAPQASADPMQIWLAIGAIVWAIGAAGLLLYASIQYLRLRARVRDAVRTELDVYETDAVISPFVIGMFKPRIILPVGMSARERESVLLHERAHIYRFDHVAKPLAFLILSIHWFNPVVWLSFRLFCDDMEASCDERAIRALDREKIAQYGETLLRLGTRKTAFSGGPLAFGEHCTKGRIINVLNYKKPAFWIVTLAVLAAVTTAIVLLANPMETPKEITEPTISPIQVEAPSIKELQPINIEASDFEVQAFVVPDSNSGTTTLIGGDIGDQLKYKLDISVLGDTTVLSDDVAAFANRLANGQNYISMFLEKNAAGCYDEEAANRLIEYTIFNNDEYRYYLDDTTAEVHVGEKYWRCEEYYIFLVLHPESLHWQHYGYAEYLGSVLNPYDLYLAKINDGVVSTATFGEYAQIYRDHGGRPINLSNKDYRLLVDSVAYYCLVNGMNWGTAYESYPITEVYGFTEPAEEGDDMSVSMASSFCAYLAETFGFDKLTSYCAGQNDFAESFGVTFERAFESWKETLLEKFS